MTTPISILLLALLAGAPAVGAGAREPFVSAHPAAGGRPRQGAPEPAAARLTWARIQVRVLNAREADIEARVRLAGASSPVLLLVEFPGQQVRGLAASVGGAPVAAAWEQGRRGAVRRLRIGPVPEGVELLLRYRLRQAATYAYRFPLPVPAAVPDAATTSVRLEVLLPEGARYRGDGFPSLVRMPTQRTADSRAREVPGSGASVGGATPWVADLVGVPGFLHVVFDDEGRWPAPQRIEALALAVAILPCLVAAVAWWRRRRQPEEGAP